MASFKLDPIFKGGISSGAARALLAFLEEKDAFDAYVIPSVGNYTAAQIIVQSGVDPDKVFCSDTNLYSAVLGHLFDPTLMIDDLGFKALDPVLVALLTKSPALEYGDQIIAAARILYALKWCQLSGTSAYTRGLRAEVEHGVETILNAYAHTLTTLVSLLGGLHYETRAPYDHIPDATGDPAALIVFNSTHYGRVTPKTEAFTWSRPPGIELKEKETKEVQIGDAHACILLYGTEGNVINDLAEAETGGWEAMYAELNVKKMTRTYFLCNRESRVAMANRRKLRTVPENLPPIYDDHEITAETEIGFVKVDRDTALYFYDLFVKELGMVDAEVFYLFCIDGQVAGALGLDSNHYRMRRIPKIYQTFVLSLTSERYARLGRLLIAGICSQQFIDQFAGEHCPKDLMLPPIAEIQTTCLTKFHEAKKNRGLMKLISREKLDNGRFQLIYRTKVHPTTYRDVVATWFKKHVNFKRKGQGGTTQ